MHKIDLRSIKYILIYIGAPNGHIFATSLVITKSTSLTSTWMNVHLLTLITTCFPLYRLVLPTYMYMYMHILQSS